MQDAAIAAEFHRKREWLSKSWLAVGIAFVWLSVQLFALDYVRSIRVIPFMGVVSVLLWYVWWQWQCVEWNSECAVGTVGIAVLGRALVVHAVIMLWQWWSGEWMMGFNHLTTIGDAFVMVVWAPVTEELAFRRLLLSESVKARGSVSSVFTLSLVNGACFALHHLWNLVSFPTPYVVLQCMAAFVAGTAAAMHVLTHSRSGLFEVILLHFVNNLIALFYNPSAINAGSPMVWLYFVAINASNIAWIARNLTN